MNAVESVIIFGGTGFIGTHLAMHLSHEHRVQKIALVDINPPRIGAYTAPLQEGLASGRVQFVKHDLRQPIPGGLFEPRRPDIIFNLAAIHREPGHLPVEYFETNLLEAEVVCAYASAVGCNRLVFTSSISQYGPCENLKDEMSLSVPETPYGSSKLAAEKIHLIWQAKDSERELLIIRPGVIFGPGEGGNVTRLVRSLVKGYFVYVGNEGTRKAGGYVKELCRVIEFGLKHQENTGEKFTLLNFSMDPAPALKEYVDAIQQVAGLRRRPMRIPRGLLVGSSHIVNALSQIFHIQQPVNPVRVRKLYRSTSIDPKWLRDFRYPWKFTLIEALEDWKRDRPEDFKA